MANEPRTPRHQHVYTGNSSSRRLACACQAWVPGPAATPADHDVFAAWQNDEGQVAVSSTTDAEASEKRRVMESQWMVKAVTETQDKITATLVRGVWFRENPDYRQMMDEYDALVEQVGIEEADRRSAEEERPWTEEFLDAGPDVEGAIFSEEGETITVDVTKAAFTLHAGDTLSMTLDRLGQEVADGDA